MSIFNAGATISVEEAQKLVKTFQEQFPKEIKASLFDSELILELLKQEGCVGLRIYNGYDTESKRMCPVLVGVNHENHDMTKGIILDRSIPCPDFCAEKSDL